MGSRGSVRASLPTRSTLWAVRSTTFFLRQRLDGNFHHRREFIEKNVNAIIHCTMFVLGRKKKSILVSSFLQPSQAPQVLLNTKKEKKIANSASLIITGYNCRIFSNNDHQLLGGFCHSDINVGWGLARFSIFK